jgi:crotonobetaine/carnitine-CoA ligase
VLSTLWAGGTVVLQPRFSRSRYWPAAIEHRATVGSHVNFTTAALMADAVPSHRFRQWITPRFDVRQQQRFGLTLVAGWGMTETLVQVIVSRPGCSSVDGAIGRPSLAYGVHVEDDAGAPVAPGDAGHLLVRGERGVSLFKGYDGDDAATAQAFDARGLFGTGDRVRLCADGSILFEDRLKDVIKVGGENVSALEVEQAIARVPGVKEAAVVARPDPAYGETVVAFVVPAAGAPADLPARVAEECARRLAKFKVPREVRLLEALPRVGVGKVAKAVLRDALRQDAAALPQVLALARSTVAEEPAP